MRIRVLLCVLVLAESVRAEEKPAVALPTAWHGEWRGKMINTSAADKQTEVSLVFVIAPMKGTNELTWAITCGEGDKKLVKDYKLVPGAKPGRFRIDEGKGVALDARLVGGVLYSHFDAGGSFLTARYELREDTLRFEVTSVKAGEGGKGKVHNLMVEAVQTAELKKR